MTPIEHSVTGIKQKPAECMQTATAQMLAFYDSSVKLEEVVRDVPLHIENGEKIGTSPGHLAAYLAKKYDTTIYVFDTELFDRSWKGMSSQEILKNLRERQKHIPENAWLARFHNALVSGWEMYVNVGGSFSIEPVSVRLLRSLLDDGPFLMMLNSTYLNQENKWNYNKETDKFDPDPIKGRSLTHAVTCAGYRNDSFLIVDPDPPKDEGHQRWIAQDHLIASIMAAQTESDNLLMTVKK